MGYIDLKTASAITGYSVSYLRRLKSEGKITTFQRTRKGKNLIDEVDLLEALQGGGKTTPKHAQEAKV